ncbi:ABC transporter ATP-binding protein [Syntrophomonas wolfei]|jgi:NitT/TauT family transport system ATP-binding protein|uniref:ABC transporter ATP-binding protein n=1 Tax=Syntrophomonas wolfei TaxID=863 RepID=UPI0023F1DE7A|nr:ABC transporter ATP-binding protein [Syntrophomonas wolfei]
MCLELIDVNKVFSHGGSNNHVLKDINLSIANGEFLCILGHSGCGKTTLLNIIAGFLDKTSGQVLLQGKEVKHIGTDRVMLFQDTTLFPWLNVIENIEFGLKFKGLKKAERRKKVLDLIDLVNLKGSEHLNVHQLSGGMKQRVALARALALDSEILLMDEPFSALDAYTKDKLRSELLRIWKACQKTILLVTHDVEEAILLADRIVIIASQPGTIIREIPISLERNMRKDSEQLKKLALSIKEEFGIVNEIESVS